MNYRFFLQSDAFTVEQTGTCLCSTGDVYDCREAYPLWGNDLNIVWSKEGEEIFYRKKLTAPLTFKNDPKNSVTDYTVLKDLDFDDVVDICIVKDIDGVWTLIWEGKFTHKNCEIDEDNCTIEVTPAPRDIYDTILEKGEIEHNIMGLADNVVTRAAPGTEVFDFCKKLQHVIQFLVTQFGLDDLLYQSTFFENDLTAATSNYVTGLDPNPLNWLVISQKSDVRYEFDPGPPFDNATTGSISFLTLMKMLREIYNVRWFVEDNYLRIEHISHFTDAVGIFDLTTQTNRFANITYAAEINKYKYKNAPNREEFEYAETFQRQIGQHSKYFFDYQIDEENLNVLTHNPPDVNPNFYMFDEEPGSISDSGWVLMQTYLNAGVRTVDQYNQYFEWDDLTDKYWDHNRPYKYAIEGYENRASEYWSVKTMTTIKKIKIQNEVSWEGCDEIFGDTFDPSELVVTELGNGEINTVSYNLSSGQVTGDLLYESGFNNVPVIPTDDYLDESVAYFNTIVYPLSTARKVLIDQLVRDMKGVGNWGAVDIFAKLDFFYIFALPSNAFGDAQRNLITPSLFYATLQGSTVPAFASDAGFTSDGANGYIDTGYDPSSADANMGQNDMTIGFYSPDPAPAPIGGNKYDMGCYDGTDYSYIGFNGTYLAAGNGPAGTTGGIAKPEGLEAVCRTAGATLIFRARYDDGGPTPDVNNNIVNASNGVPSSDNIYICALNNNGAATGFTQRQYSFAFGGKYITQADVDNLHDMINAYLSSI